jgi:hypothetical protein
VLTLSDCESTAVKVMSLRKETTEGPTDSVKMKGHAENREEKKENCYCSKIGFVEIGRGY